MPTFLDIDRFLPEILVLTPPLSLFWAQTSCAEAVGTQENIIAWENIRERGKILDIIK